MGELVAQISTGWTGTLPLVLADGTWGMVVVGVVIAIFIAIVVLTTARRAAEQEEQRNAEADYTGQGASNPDATTEGSGGAATAGAGGGANPNKGLASVFGLGGPSVQPPPEHERKAKLGEPEQFGVVRESLVAVLEDMDATDAQFVVPDMALQRDLGLEEEQISRLLTELGQRLGASVSPELYAKATGEDDVDLRELLERVLGIYEEPEEDEEAAAPEEGRQQ